MTVIAPRTICPISAAGSRFSPWISLPFPSFASLCSLLPFSLYFLSFFAPFGYFYLHSIPLSFACMFASGFLLWRCMSLLSLSSCLFIYKSKDILLYTCLLCLSSLFLLSAFLSASNSHLSYLTVLSSGLILSPLVSSHLISLPLVSSL